jgi:hypothetical protein
VIEEYNDEIRDWEQSFNVTVRSGVDSMSGKASVHIGDYREDFIGVFKGTKPIKLPKEIEEAFIWLLENERYN